MVPYLDTQLLTWGDEGASGTEFSSRPKKSDTPRRSSRSLEAGKVAGAAESNEESGFNRDPAALDELKGNMFDLVSQVRQGCKTASANDRARAPLPLRESGSGSV
eukprot:2255911-Rhodomonas_salina.1